MPPRPEPFDPVDFFSVARTISQEQKEGAFRTAVSRAYYCVFHLARQSTGINPDAGGNSRFTGKSSQRSSIKARTLVRNSKSCTGFERLQITNCYRIAATTETGR